jgi:hypothetical protein
MLNGSAQPKSHRTANRRRGSVDILKSLIIYSITCGVSKRIQGQLLFFFHFRLEARLGTKMHALLRSTLRKVDLAMMRSENSPLP